MYLIYESKLLNYRFREPHPMKPERYLLTYELIKSYGLIDARISVVKPKLFEEKILLLAHDEEYVDFVKSMSKLGEGYLDYGDTPAFKRCFEAALLHVSSTLTAVDIAFNRGIVSVNLAGGYHHAKRLSAGGFCIFNDIAIAVNYLADKYGVRRIAVVDFDVHHGDGTQELLYDKDVLKLIFTKMEDIYILEPALLANWEKVMVMAIWSTYQCHLIHPMMTIFWSLRR